MCVQLLSTSTHFSQRYRDNKGPKKEVQVVLYTPHAYNIENKRYRVLCNSTLYDSLRFLCLEAFTIVAVKRTFIHDHKFLIGAIVRDRGFEWCDDICAIRIHARRRLSFFIYDTHFFEHPPMKKAFCFSWYDWSIWEVTTKLE